MGSLAFTVAILAAVLLAEASAMSSYTTGCGSGVCGQFTKCQVIGGRAVCSCLPGYAGDPLTYCKKTECQYNDDCGQHHSCVNDRCVNPCDGACGSGANCEVRNHVPVCSCPAGHTGNPFTSCRAFQPDELCHPSPCGTNTKCNVVNGVPTCSCLPGYFGSPIKGCRHECETNSECSSNMACIDFRCQNPCNSQCGENAICETVQNHAAVCKCPQGYTGDPKSACRPECTSHSDCSGKTPACFRSQCVDPCDNTCGLNAICEIKGTSPICSCPEDTTGNPFISCKSILPGDICHPNPCGANAKCTAGMDKNNKNAVICSCPEDTTGNPLISCKPILPRDVCHPNPCGANAKCTAEMDKNNKNAPICSCSDDTTGNPFISCKPILPKDVCHPNPCGANAKCTSGLDKNNKNAPICSCSDDTTGNPFISCKPILPRDICHPNPCGANAKCTAGMDKNNTITAICSCRTGYHGNPLTGCERGECVEDSECSKNQTCLNYSCVNPCLGDPCGTNANCTPKNHIAVCSCPAGYSGNPLAACQKS